VIHVYGVVDELSELPAMRGVEDAPLRCRRVGELELVVSDVAANAEVTQDAVLRHAQVVDELMTRSSAVLPAQFGRPFGGEDELTAAVTSKAADLARGLNRVRGCVEFGLRAVSVAAGPVAHDPSGAGYMRARLEEERQRERLIARAHEPLAALARATAPATASAGGVFECAYLVPAASVEAFRDAVRRVEAASPELTLVCTGPWPPYSFGSSREDAA
jgi:hypothetical protein